LSFFIWELTSKKGIIFSSYHFIFHKFSFWEINANRERKRVRKSIFVLLLSRKLKKIDVVVVSAFVDLFLRFALILTKKINAIRANTRRTLRLWQRTMSRSIFHSYSSIIVCFFLNWWLLWHNWLQIVNWFKRSMVVSMISLFY